MTIRTVGVHRHTPTRTFFSATVVVLPRHTYLTHCAHFTLLRFGCHIDKSFHQVIRRSLGLPECDGYHFHFHELTPLRPASLTFISAQYLLLLYGSMTSHRTNTDFVLLDIGTMIHLDNRNQCRGRTMKNFGKPGLRQPSPLWSQRLDMALEPLWCHGRQTGIKVFDRLVRTQHVDVALGHSHFSLAPVHAIHCKTVVPSIPSDTVFDRTHSMRPSLWSAPEVVHCNWSATGFV